MLSFAEVAESCLHWVAPSVDDGLILAVREGRHPVVEGAIGRGAFVPNDCVIDPKEQQILLPTGPNMAGKSTYMRQVALITSGADGKFCAGQLSSAWLTVCLLESALAIPYRAVNQLL